MIKKSFFPALVLGAFLATVWPLKGLTQPVLKTTEAPILMFSQVNHAHLMHLESPLSALKHVDLKQADTRTKESFHQFMKQRQLMEQPVQKLEQSQLFH
jgi:hypothetical protein